MRKQVLVFLIIFFSVLQLKAQGGNEYNAIKLFVSPYSVSLVNAESNTEVLQDRLYRKLIQLINQTGVAEIGYSTFHLSADFDVLSTSVSQTGISKIYLSECELVLSVLRTSVGESTSGEAVFHSFSKKIAGSGASKEEALANALSSISAKDKSILAFLQVAKEKISAYYQANCNEVIRQAEQMLALKDYEGSIALYFSVPANAPCYEDAVDASQKVFITYIEDQCTKKLVKLKSYIALAQTENGMSKNYYDSAMIIMSNLSPSSDKCYIESMKEIEKIEKRLNDQQKKEWELLKQLASDATEVDKAHYKAMGKINQHYQPPTSPNNSVIIVK